MAYLTIEFTGRFTANDEEIRDAVARANEVFRKAGTTAEKAWAETSRLAEETGYMTDLWTAADYAATKSMGEAAHLAWL